MNFYVGKGFDTFEAVMHMLIASQGREVPGHIDCSAGRCFAFDCSGRVQDWFSPRISNYEAIERLNRWFGLGLYPSDVSGLTEPFALGPLVNTPIDNLAHKYYNGGGIYVFCMPHNDSLLVHDPYGHPAVVVERAEFSGKAEAIALKKSGTIRRPAYREILLAGMELKRHNPWEDSPDFEREARVPLQYAIRNYLCQVTKVLQLIDDVAKLGSTVFQEIQSIYAQMLSVNIKQTLELINLDHQLWDLLEEIVDGVRA